MFYGFFHGDVHAGNLMLLDDDTIGFLDFGIVGRFDDKARYLVTDYMIAFASGNYKRLAEIIIEMARRARRARHGGASSRTSARPTAPLLKLSFGEVNYADFLPGIQRTATRHQMRMPNEFVLITKQLLYFDRYAKSLAPKLNVFTDPRLVLGMMSDIQKARMQHEAKLKAQPRSRRLRADARSAEAVVDALLARLLGGALLTEVLEEQLEVFGRSASSGLNEMPTWNASSTVVHHATRAGRAQRLGLRVVIEHQRDLDLDIGACCDLVRRSRSPPRDMLVVRPAVLRADVDLDRHRVGVTRMQALGVAVGVARRKLALAHVDS